MDKIGVEVLLEHAAFVKALARRLVRDEATAEDVAQQTWLAALRRPPDRNPRSWLGTVARNVVRGVVRSDRRRLRRERTAARSESVGPADAEVTRAELLRSVTDAVLALPEQDREVILLRFYENLPPREIARKFGIPSQTVRSRLHRAVSRLRAQLDGKHGGRGVWMLSLAVLA
jgi:RNA polymerase sigma-70 factor (ECF subfamily)